MPVRHEGGRLEREGREGSGRVEREGREGGEW